MKNKSKLLNMWLQAFERDANHAINDANRNLKGFTQAMKYHIEHQSLPVAFRASVNAALSRI